MWLGFGFSKYLLTTETAVAKSGLVPNIAYIKLPTIFR